MRMSSTFVSMDFQQSVSMMYQFSIFCLLAQAITTQNVVIGDTIMQTDRTAQISCTFDDGFVSALYWSVGPLGGSVIPADSIILYSPGLGVIIRNPAYEGRINMTDDYGLIIYEVQDEDIDLRYWCHVNVDGRTGEDSEDAVKAVPIKPTLKVSQQCGECCDAGETVLCEVDGFTPAGDFNIMWKVDGEEDPDGTLILVPSGNVSYANSTLKIKKGSAEEQIYTCEAMGRAYTYATSEENHSNITIDVCKAPTTTIATSSKPTTSPDKPSPGPRPGPPPGPLGLIIGLILCCLGIVLLAIAVWMCPKKPDYVANEPDETQAQHNIIWKDGGLCCKSPCTTYQVLQNSELIAEGSNNSCVVKLSSEGSKLDIQAKTCCVTSNPLHVVIPAAPQVIDCHCEDGNSQIINFKVANIDFKCKYHVSFDGKKYTPVNVSTITEEGNMSIEASVAVEGERSFTIIAASGNMKSTAANCVVKAKPQQAVSAEAS